MKIDIENLGGIDKGSIELNDFTIFCGKNNSGKTYVMYSIYGLLTRNFYPVSSSLAKTIWDKLKKQGIYEIKIDELVFQQKDELVRNLEKGFKDYLPKLFGLSQDGNEFTQTKIKLNFDDNVLINRIYNKRYEIRLGNDVFNLKKKEKSQVIQLMLSNAESFNTDFQKNTESMVHHLSQWLSDIIFTERSSLFPAERSGLNLFFRELLSIRNSSLQELQNDNIDNPISFLKDITMARYAEPIKDYIKYLSEVGFRQSQFSEYLSYAKSIEQDVLGGSYELDYVGNISFMPSKSNNKLPLHFTSSTVKTLFGLVFYLKHLAKEGDYLMIDEPELNLHPDNQRQVARVLAQLVNAGLKVIVSTHSDYFVRELNNLIMLKNDFSGAKELQKKYGYQDNELLASKQVSAYLFDNKKITPMILDKEEGIIAETFDDVINNLNKSSNEIYYAMQDAKELND